jgi:arylsulfatase A-like enzyme
MKNPSSSMSRKDALKKLGGLALTLPFGMPLASAVIGNTVSAKTHFPHIIPQRKPDKPNILWITTEGVPLSVLSCYGSRVMQTPNIDRLAKEGMLFNNSFCNNALCAPSRATLLTGKYDHLNGMLSNPGNTTNGQTNSTFDPTQETFAQLLQRAGYKTGLVGKWHLVSGKGQPSNPGEAGFDYFVFKRGAGGPYYNEKGYLQNPSLGSHEIQQKSYPGYMTDTFTDLTIEGIKQLKEPFCFAVQYFNDHRPFEPPHKYEHIYDDVRFPEPGTFWDDYRFRSAAAREAHMRISDMMDFNPPKDYTSRQRQQWSYQQLMRRFLATLKAQDDNIGRLLAYLDKTGLADNTIVVFTGDHGFFLGEHGWFDKRFMYEEALRVPWIIRYPGGVKPGSTSDAWVQSIDNAPTILDMAGLPVPGDMQGKSLVPVFSGKTPADWRKSMYYHYYEFAPPHWVLPNYGIRTERYKLISYYSINEWELFDLDRDPDEMESLFEEGGMQVRAGYEDTLRDMLSQLKDLRQYYKDDTGKPVKFWPRRTYN